MIGVRAVQLINIGYGNMISAAKVVAIVSPEAAPVKRMVQNARDRHMLVHASCGRKTKAVIVTDSGHIVLAAVSPEALSHRISGTEQNGEEDEDEE